MPEHAWTHPEQSAKAGYPVSKWTGFRRYHGRALSVLIQSMPAKPGIVICYTNRSGTAEGCFRLCNPAGNGSFCCAKIGKKCPHGQSPWAEIENCPKPKKSVEWWSLHFYPWLSWFQLTDIPWPRIWAIPNRNPRPGKDILLFRLSPLPVINWTAPKTVLPQPEIPSVLGLLSEAPGESRRKLWGNPSIY